MTRIDRIISLAALVAWPCIQATAQNLLPTTIEAESAANDATIFQTVTDGGVTFVRVVTDLVDGNSPGTASRVISYSVTFPSAGIYRLYGRMRIGPAGFNDDSFFYGNGFGAKTFNNANDWQAINGLAGGGFTLVTDTVAGNGGGGTGFRWFDLTGWSGGNEGGLLFNVPAGNLTQTFQIGSRENGLDFDKFAFGENGVFFTVGQLDAGTAGTVVPPPPPFDPPGPPIAQGKDKYLGSAHSAAQAPNFNKYWNQVTPENGGKWGSVEGTRDVMNWTDADAAYALAKANGFPFRFHTLFWGAQQPTWMTMTDLLGDPELRKQEQLAEIHEWLAAVAAHFTPAGAPYPDIDMIDVVNEPLHDPPDGNHPGNAGGNFNSCGDYIEALGGAGVTGWDWVITAFQLARQYFPASQLTLNDFSITNDGNATTTYLTIIGLLQERGLIDAIGEQGHAFSTRGSMLTHENNLDRLAATGLPIHITELDIDGPTDAVQLADYQRIFPTFWEHPGVDGITLWGWRIGHWRTAQGDYLVLNNGAERPAIVWLRAYVNTPIVHAAQTFPIDGGVCNVVATALASYPDGTVLTAPADWQITGGDGAGIFAIESTTGAIRIHDPLALDFSRTSYTLIVTAGNDDYTSAPVEIMLTIANKLKVCHKNGKVLSVSKHDVPELLAIGGCLGSCSP